jgi:hypothetical protein
MHHLSKTMMKSQLPKISGSLGNQRTDAYPPKSLLSSEQSRMFGRKRKLSFFETEKPAVVIGSICRFPIVCSRQGFFVYHPFSPNDY